MNGTPRSGASITMCRREEEKGKLVVRNKRDFPDDARSEEKQPSYRFAQAWNWTPMIRQAFKGIKGFMLKWSMRPPHPDAHRPVYQLAVPLARK